jgi:DNA-binding IclR family transcriptional regulator
MNRNATRVNLVPALERGTRILDFVARSNGFPKLAEMSRELNIARSSVHTLCNTLVQLELLVRRSDQTFQLGPQVMRWANAFHRQSDVATEFTAIWDSETDLPGATITLSVLDETEVVYIAARNSTGGPSLFEFRTGMRLPAAFTATGKAFLSHLSNFGVRKLFPEGLPPQRTPYSVRDIETLLEELDDIRRNGYSFDNQQIAEGLVCYGASVLDWRNRPIAGVAVSLPVGAVSGEDQSRAICNVQRIATRLSHRMGADLAGARPFTSEEAASPPEP